MTADIERYEVSGNTLLPQPTLAQALGPVPARVGFDDIQRTAQALQQAYRDAGYGAVVVRIPEQNLQQRVVRLEVIEGRLAQVQVVGQQAFSRDNILRSLPALRLGQTPDLKALDSELLMANENPAKSLRVVLQPGEQRADVEALAVVEEMALSRWQWTLDNTGNNSTGNARLSLGYQHANLFDRDMVLGLRATTSPSDPAKVQVFGATLRVPLYTQRLFLEGSLLGSNTSNVTNSTPAGDLRFSGKGQAAGLRVLWMLPSLGETKAQASVGVDARRYRNDCSLGQFGAAGCGTAAASVDVLPLTLGYRVYRLGHWSAHGEYVANLPWGTAGRDADFDASRPGARSNYRLLRAGAMAQHSLTPRWSIGWRLDGQWAMTPLVPAEQFGAGGAASVRGYHERVLNTDSGLNVSLELKTPWSTLTGGAQRAQESMLSVFVDAAALHNRLDTPCSPGRSRCNLWSAGLGVALRPFDQTTLVRLELARAGRTAGPTSAGDWRWHISLNYFL